MAKEAWKIIFRTELLKNQCAIRQFDMILKINFDWLEKKISLDLGTE